MSETPEHHAPDRTIADAALRDMNALAKLAGRSDVTSDEIRALMSAMSGIAKQFPDDARITECHVAALRKASFGAGDSVMVGHSGGSFKMSFMLVSTVGYDVTIGDWCLTIPKPLHAVADIYLSPEIGTDSCRPIGIRPEDLRICEDGFLADVSHVDVYPRASLLSVFVGNTPIGVPGVTILVRVLVFGDCDIKEGDSIRLALKPADIDFYPVPERNDAYENWK